MGFLDKLMGRRRRPPAKRGYDDYRDRYQDNALDYEGPEDTEGTSLLVDHHLDFVSSDDYRKNFSKMVYKLDIENGTDYPMGNVRVEFPKSTKLGRFGEPELDGKMLDPGENMKVSVPFIPSYHGGKDEFEFEIIFFDFNHKVEERVVLKSEPIKVVVPRFKPEKLDEDSYRFLTGDLYRWSTETEVMKIDPKELYTDLKERLLSIGFKEANELYNDSMFRGITQLGATDDKGRKWAAQIQVIGRPGESKLLLYTFGERPLQAYSLAVKVLLKFEGRDTIVDSIVE
jgi:hypothetical protein